MRQKWARLRFLLSRARHPFPEPETEPVFRHLCRPGNELILTHSSQTACQPAKILRALETGHPIH